jgi:hypothetical protein
VLPSLSQPIAIVAILLTGTEHHDYVPRPNKINTAISVLQEQREGLISNLNANEILFTQWSNNSSVAEPVDNQDVNYGRDQKKRKIAANNELNSTSKSPLLDWASTDQRKEMKKPRAMRPYCTNCKGNDSSPKCDHVIPCTPCLNSGRRTRHVDNYNQVEYTSLDNGFYAISSTARMLHDHRTELGGTAR